MSNPFHTHFDSKNWNVKTAFKTEPSKGKSKVYCLVCGEFLGMKPGAIYFDSGKGWRSFFGRNRKSKLPK